jgi:hypothetical protein
MEIKTQFSISRNHPAVIEARSCVTILSMLRKRAWTCEAQACGSPVASVYVSVKRDGAARHCPAPGQVADPGRQHCRIRDDS